VVAERIDFDNPTFLIGPNASGKSNLVDAIALASEAMRLPLRSVFGKRGGFDRIKNKTNGESGGIAIRADFGGLHLNQTAHYSFEVQQGGESGIKVVREQFVARRADDVVWFDRDHDSKIRSNLSVAPSLDPEGLALVLLSGAEAVAQYARLLRDATICVNLQDSFRKPQQVDDGLTFYADGSNSVSVVRRILGLGNAGDLLRSKLGALLPDFRDLRYEWASSNELTLRFEQELKGKRVSFEPGQMSEGTLRVLGLLAVLLQEKKPRLVVIEEPETSLHPSAAMGIVQHLLRRYSNEMQIIVTTHNTDLLDAKWIEDRHIRMVTWDNGETRVTPVSQSTSRALKLEDVGSALRANVLSPPDPIPAKIPDQLEVFESTDGFPSWPNSKRPVQQG